MIKIDNIITKTPIMSIRFQKGRQAYGQTDKQIGGRQTDTQT